MKLQRLLMVACIFACAYTSFGQQAQTQPLPYFTFGKGLGITAPDSLFSLNLRFRIQNRVAFETISESDLGISEVEARVRRLRLRFDGFVYSPKLTYLIQLSFSRGDMDYDALGFPNIIRDAYIQYAITKEFSVGFGQTKLPGNRQRTVSSGDQQFVDRSLVNATFNIDRDFGLQFGYKKKHVSLRAAVSSGEGRNMTTSNNGLAYTGRIELFPFGPFTNGGDYFEGDLAREATPKLAIAAAYSHNEDAVRTGGQLGPMLYAPTDMKTQMFDLLYKFNGWSLSAEYMKRNATDPISIDPVSEKLRFVYVGHGENVQLSYLLKSNWEFVGRYSKITPGDEITEFENEKEHFTGGVNKYFKGHRVKVQGDLTLEQNYQDAGPALQAWICRLQIELGI